MFVEKCIYLCCTGRTHCLRATSHESLSLIAICTPFNGNSLYYSSVTAKYSQNMSAERRDAYHIARRPVVT